MLHIITPLYRFELLEKVYRSIPEHTDITWHISKSSHREKLKTSFIDSDSRVRCYEVDCPDSDTIAKRNAVFDVINDGYFYLLDDDTIFLPELYAVYQEYSSKGFVGMVIGDQKMAFGPSVLRASYPTITPETTMIDSGMVLCHHSVLRSVRWAESSTFRDRDFWSRCYQYFGRDAVRLENKTISVYNYFGHKIRVQKKIFFVNLDFTIYNSWLAELYDTIARSIDSFKNSRNK
jgi:hypothetical protein